MNCIFKSLLRQLSFLLIVLGIPHSLLSQQTNPRVLVSTDIGGTDPDDNQSLAHLLMCSDMVDIEGLVSSPSFGDGDKSEILRMIDLYELDFPRLSTFYPGLTPPDSLRPLVRQGVRSLAPLRGFTKATEGSDRIIECARKDDTRPLWVLVWGTLDDLAQALHDAPDIADKIKVYYIGGPNKKWGVNSYDYIARNFPDLWMIENNASYRGFISDSKIDSHYHARYYDDAIAGAGHLGHDFKNYYDGNVKMGDSPSLFYLLDGDPDDPSSSSWGGRFERMNRSPHYTLSPGSGDRDTVNTYSVVEFSVESTDPSDSLLLFIDRQKWLGERVSPERLTIRYSPKQTDILPYTVVCGTDTITATLYVDNIWPGNNMEAYTLGDHWYTDISNPGFFIGKWQGAETVASGRKDVLDHWQQRWDCLKDTVAPPTPAFPGAEGFGKYATGGRGGKVYHVTTLADGNRPGTLRHAVMQSGPRTVVFDVAGTIMLDSMLRITEGDLTIAGQSAPGDGICIAGYPVVLKGDNTIVRYLRFRVGDIHRGDHDGIGGTDFKNMILDHCSVSWSVDECCGLYGGEDFTVQWCIFSEPLRCSGHSKGGAHGYGAIFGGARASYHHNLIAHGESRMPRLGPRPGTQTREHLDMRNNVIYNWAGAGCYGGEGMRANIVNNYYKPGPATPRDGLVGHRIFCPGVRTESYVTRRDGSLNQWAPMLHRWGEYFIDGNVMEGNPEVTTDNWTDGVLSQIDREGNDRTFTPEIGTSMRLSSPIAYAGVTSQSAEDAFESVLNDAGCSHVRDAVDLRIIDETRQGTASLSGSRATDAADRCGFIDTLSDAIMPGQKSAWPTLKASTKQIRALHDTDGDGIPDRWEKTHGLDPGDPTDGAALTSSGYTNLELYLNSII